MSGWEDSIKLGELSDSLRSQWEAFGGWGGRSTLAVLRCERGHKLAEVWRSTEGLTFALRMNRWRFKLDYVADLPDDGEIRRIYETGRSDNQSRKPTDASATFWLAEDLCSGEGLDPMFACSCRTWKRESLSAVSEAVDRRFGASRAVPSRRTLGIVDEAGSVTWRSR